MQTSEVEENTIKLTAAANETSPQRQKLQQPEVTQELAAILAEVKPRTNRNWDKGIGTPQGYPGRQSRAVFVAFATTRKNNRRLKEEARAMNRAISISDVDRFSEEDKEDEEEKW
jgi:hypothetical protein